MAVVLGGLAACSLGSASFVSAASFRADAEFSPGRRRPGGDAARRAMPGFGGEPRPRPTCWAGASWLANLNDDMSFAPRKQSFGSLVREAAGASCQRN